MLWARIPRAITINVAEVESPPLDDREAHLVQFTEPAATSCAHSFRTNWCRQPYPRADVDRRLTSPHAPKRSLGTWLERPQTPLSSGRPETASLCSLETTPRRGMCR